MEIADNRVIVRSLRPDDAEGLAENANDREIWLNLRDVFPFPYNKSDADSFIAMVSSQNPETSFLIEVEGDPAGTIGITLGTDISSCSAEVGYWLGRTHWGKGNATAVLRMFTPWAIKQFGVHRLFGLPFADNLASIRVLEKADYSKEGVLKSSAVKDGVTKDQVIYAYIAQ